MDYASFEHRYLKNPLIIIDPFDYPGWIRPVATNIFLVSFGTELSVILRIGIGNPISEFPMLET
jgi:hypothetical protein